MKIETNLALYPAAARRRATWLLLLSLLFGVVLTASHLVWSYSGGPPATTLRGDAELLTREAAALRERLDGLHEALDPAVIRELSDRVGIANDFIVRGAVDPVALLDLIESTAPESLLMERLSLTSSGEGVRAELTLRAADQAAALGLINELRDNPSIHDITPVSEQIADSGDQIVLSLLYRPQRFEGR